MGFVSLTTTKENQMKRVATMQKELKALGFDVYVNEYDNMVTLTSERGNMGAFEYINCDYPVDLTKDLHDLAKRGGYEWQCEYTGTYKLYPLQEETMENQNIQLYKFIINNEVFQENLTHLEAENLYYELADSGYVRIEKQEAIE